MNNVGYFNAYDTPFGLSYNALTVKWGQWIWSISEATNPFSDHTGKNASINQPEKVVWFLAGTWATERLLNVPNRKVTITSDRSINN